MGKGKRKATGKGVEKGKWKEEIKERGKGEWKGDRARRN